MIEHRSETLIFLHLPKTAGATLRSIVQRQYARRRSYIVPLYPGRGIPPVDEIIRDIERLPRARLDSLELVAGHFPFGIHRALPRTSRYITMVRDPVELAISTYWYVRRSPTHRSHEETMRMSLRDFVERNVPGHIQNGQTARLAGEGNWHHHTPELLERAIDNIRRSFAAVGVTERFDESLLVFRERLGWRRSLIYAQKNVTKGRPAREAVDEDVVRLIESVNTLDLELWRTANEMLDAQLSAMEPGVEARLRTLRVRNRRFSPAMAIWQKAGRPLAKVEGAFRRL